MPKNHRTKLPEKLRSHIDNASGLRVFDLELTQDCGRRAGLELDNSQPRKPETEVDLEATDID